MSETIQLYTIPTLRTINDVLTAAAAIAAFSIILFTVQYNRRERLTQAFIPLLLCITAIYSADALESVTSSARSQMIWQKIHWTGFIFLPGIFLYFASVLLSMTGVRFKKSVKGIVTACVFLIAVLFVRMLWNGSLFTGIENIQGIGTAMVMSEKTWAFWCYFGVLTLVVFYELGLTYSRTQTHTGRRRMTYLIIGAFGILVGTFPLLLFGSGLIIARYPLFFWSLSVLANLTVVIMIMLLGYSVSSFSVPWSDRQTRQKMFEWLLRGPFTASVTLGLTTLTSRGSGALGINIAGLSTLVTVVSIVMLEFLVGLILPRIERSALTGYGKEDYAIYKQISRMMVFKPELTTFLEAMLSSLAEKYRAGSAFVAVINEKGEIDPLIHIGERPEGDPDGFTERFEKEDCLYIEENGYMVYPIFYRDENVKILLGMIGLNDAHPEAHDSALTDALDKARTVLWQRRYLTVAYATLRQAANNPTGDVFRQGNILNSGTILNTSEDEELRQISEWVKDALSHYWGGPRLSENPLLKIRLISRENADSPVNALRSVLKKAIDRIRPEGARSYNGEWMLYNILDLKFIEKMKVKDIAARLAISEADFYRKQKIAVESVAKEIIQMEKEHDEREATGTE